MSEEKHMLSVTQAAPSKLLELADRLDTNKRSWLPISGHVVNVTFNLNEADAISAALRTFATHAAAPADISEKVDPDDIAQLIREHIWYDFGEMYGISDAADAIASTYSLTRPEPQEARETLEAQGIIEQLEKQLAYERKKYDPNSLHAPGSPLWRISMLCEQQELYTKDELVGLIQKVVQEAGRPNV